MNVSIIYQLLNGCVVTKDKFLNRHLFKGGDFISQASEEPKGMFVVLSFDEKGLVLEEINCDPVHWKGTKDGYAKGPDETCMGKCEFYDDCPFTVPLLMGADID